MAKACPSPQQLVEFAQGQTDEFVTDTITNHVASCKLCSTVVQSLMQSNAAAAQTPPPAQAAPTQVPPPAAPVTAQVAEPPAPAKEVPASGGLGKALPWIVAGVAIVAAGVGIAGANLGWFSGGKDPVVINDPDNPNVNPDGPTNPDNPTDADGNAKKLKGFQMGQFNPSDPIDKIKVTLKVSENGSALMEGVDLRLGFGFPLRLYPVGTDEREPSFAAFPQTASLTPGSNVVNPGESAWFEFAAKPESPGMDDLRTTPALLSDLKAGDIHSIGFASKGTSDWVLEGYEIEVNGELYASNDSANVRVGEVQKTNQTELQSLMPPYQSLATEVSELQAYVDTGFAADKDKEQLKTKTKLLQDAEGPLAEIAGRVAGNYPFFQEADAAFKPTAEKGPLAKQVTVTLVTGSDDSPGTSNPVYLYVGGQKHLLTSEVDFLVDDQGQQRFRFASADLEIAPISSASLADVGIGVVGNDRRFNQIPDRARLQRVIVEADDKVVYDSETKPLDRRTLGAIWLVPPGHRDDLGNAVENQKTDYLVHLWKPGMAINTQVATTTTGEDDPSGAGTKAGGTKGGIKVPPKQPKEPKPVIEKKNPFLEEQLALEKDKLNLEKDKLKLEKERLALEREKMLRDLYSGLNPFSRSRRFNPARPYTPVIYIPYTPPTPVTPNVIIQKVPVTKDPTLANVRVSSPVGLVQHGDTPTVNWDVLGDATKIESYTVEMVAISPHDSTWLHTTPVAKGSILFSASSFTQHRFGSPLDIAKSRVIGKAQTALFVQPKVTATYKTVSAVGASTTTTIKTITKEGPLVPLAPRFNTGTNRILNPIALGPHASQGLLLSGAGGGTYGISASQAPGYQRAGDGFGFGAGTANPLFNDCDCWRNFTLVDPTTGRPSANAGNEAWLLNAKSHEDCQTFSFAPFANNIGMASWSVTPPPAAAPLHPNDGGKHITLRFDGVVDLSKLSPKKDLHFIAHAGFIDEAASQLRDSTATINARVVVRDTTASGAGLGASLGFPVRASSTTTTDASELMRIETATSIDLKDTALSPSRMQLIDIPILFDKTATQYDTALGAQAAMFTFDTNTTAAQNAGQTAFAAEPDLALKDQKKSDANKKKTLGVTTPVVKSATLTKVYVSVTLMIEQTSVNAKEGVGIFGARLVREP